ncbi:hypothetical protein POM88_043424 [Heracleum sosnowskyi]|uniref:Uncharacterized protein n=1 Tax=Heracleum sosnowskyi TaxID=360622 RepID=A0AAD8M210_9APIA|nr:hypothetical protein POM88_043424 [Heracleum sosnowskyi]
MLFRPLVAAPAEVVLCSVMGSTIKQLFHHALDSPTVQREETRQEKACKKMKKTLLIQQYDSFTVKPDLYWKLKTRALVANVSSEASSIRQSTKVGSLKIAAVAWINMMIFLHQNRDPHPPSISLNPKPYPPILSVLLIHYSLVAAAAAVLFCIEMGSTNKHSHHVLDSPTAHCEGTKQERAYKESLLVQQYHSFTAKPGESLTNLYKRFSTLINNLKLFGKTYDNYEINLKFILGLWDSWEWEIITTGVRNCNDIKVMPLHKLFDVLNKHDLEQQKEKLIRKYHEFSARPGESVTELYDRFNRLVNDLRLLGRTCGNHEVNLKFIQAVPSSWDKRATPITICNDMHAMTLQKLYEKLETYEMEDRKEELIRKYHRFTAKPGESITELHDRFNRLVNDLRLLGRTCENYEELYEKFQTYELEDRKEELIRKYHKFTAKPGESITKLYDRFNRLVNDLRLLGRTCENYEVNLKFIQALPSFWDKWAAPIRFCNDMHAMPLQVLYGKLKAYELEDQQKKELRQYHKINALVEDGVDSDKSAMCSRG